MSASPQSSRHESAEFGHIYFLLCRLWGMGKEQGCRYGNYVFSCGGHISDWNRCCEQHADTQIPQVVYPQRGELLGQSWTRSLRLLNWTRPCCKLNPYFFTRYVLHVCIRHRQKKHKRCVLFCWTVTMSVQSVHTRTQRVLLQTNQEL